MLTTLQIKLIIYAVLAAGIGGGVLYIKHVFNERGRLEASLKDAELSRDTAIASVFLYHENSERQVKLISEYQVKLDEKQAANSSLERDVAAGRKQLRIRGASCSPSTLTADSGATEAAPQYSADFRHDLFRIRSGIITLESNYALCLQILDEDRRQKNAPKFGG